MRSAITPLRLHRLAVLVAILLGAIVVTGGAVRLTDSGLGCPTWPRCTATSLVAPADSHALVEFINRVVTTLVGVVVGALAVAATLAPTRRRDITWLAWSLVAGFVGQAVVGGLSVLYDLAPPFVIAHFLLSMAMLYAALLLVHRADPGSTPADSPVVVPVRRELRILSTLLVAVAGIVLTLGTLTTGTGPHAGAQDGHVHRLHLPLERVTQLHADSALFLTGLTVAMLFAVRLADTTALVRRRATWLAAAIGVQVAIGYTQYFLNLPASVVELHIAGATFLWCAAVWLHLGLTATAKRCDINLAEADFRLISDRLASR